MQIENHETIVIASDGSTFEPVPADTLYFINCTNSSFHEKNRGICNFVFLLRKPPWLDTKLKFQKTMKTQSKAFSV